VTDKKPISTKIASVLQPAEVNSAKVLKTEARPESLAIHDDVIIQRVGELLAMLSRSKLHLPESIIRCILAEQENNTP
jgi:hypothetical protein